MRNIRLIDGTQINAAQMGFCSVHEHIIPKICPSDKRGEIIQYAKERLDKAYAAGVRTIIDVSASAVIENVWDHDIELLREIVGMTAMQVVASTGFYNGPDGFYDGFSVHDFLFHIMREVEYGVKHTGIIPGAIKVASANACLKDCEIRALTAAGIAQRETGLPLCVHSVTGIDRQQEIIGAAGADLSKVYFCHAEANQGWEGRSFDEQVEIFKKVLDQGSSLSFNNFNNWTHTPEECMARLISTLSKAGYGDRLLATMDFVWSYKDSKPVVLWEDICEDRDQRDYAYLITHVHPWMREHGISEDVIHAMNYKNPARIFGS